jgi:hypothetical protein
MEIMMEIKLPFYYPPVIDAFSGDAGEVAIYVENERYNQLIFRNHFLLTYYYNTQVAGFNWDYYDDTYKNTVDLNDIVNDKNIIPLITESINDGQYVRLYLDHYYIKKTSSYMIRHFRHDYSTIFGYNDSENIFYIADNFFNGKYLIYKVDYNDLCLARKDHPVDPIGKFNYPDDKIYVLRIKDIVELLYSYLDGTCYLSDDKSKIKGYDMNKDSNVIIGMNVYQILKGQILDIIHDKKDARSFHVLYNHMCTYLTLINSIPNIFPKAYDAINGLKEEAHNLISQSLLLRNMYLKASMACSVPFINETVEKLSELSKYESQYLNELIDILGLHRPLQR